MCHRVIASKRGGPEPERASSDPGQSRASLVLFGSSKSREQTHSRNAKWHIVLFCLILKASIVIRSVVLDR